MFKLSASEITDEYIKDFVKLSASYNTVDCNIESIKAYLGILRLDLLIDTHSSEIRKEVKLLIERYTILFRDLLIERDKTPVRLIIRIPNVPYAFPPTDTPYSYR